MTARKPDTVPRRLPKNGKFFRGLLVGGPGDIYRDIQPRMLEEFGIDLEQHWRSEAGMKRIIKDSLPTGCEIAVILTDMIGHGNGQLVVKLAKATGVPYVLTGRKRSAWVMGLLTTGFESNPAWLKAARATAATVATVEAVDKLAETAKADIEHYESPVAPATPPAPSPVSMVAKNNVEEAATRDARVAVASFFATDGATSMTTLYNKIGRFNPRELRVAVANLLHEKWLFERPDRRIDFVQERKKAFIDNPTKAINSRPLDGRLDAVPLKQTVLQEITSKFGTADVVFDLPKQPHVAVRFGQGYTRDVKTTLDGIEATIAGNDGTLHRFELAWRYVYYIGNGHVARTWPECGNTDKAAMPINVPLPAGGIDDTRVEPPPTEEQKVNISTRVVGFVQQNPGCTERDVLDKIKLKASWVRWGIWHAQQCKLVWAASGGGLHVAVRPEPVAVAVVPEPKPEPVVASATMVLTTPPREPPKTLREVEEPTTDFLKKALPDAIYRQLVERGAQSVSRLGQITKYKAAQIRWALSRLVEAGRVTEGANGSWEPVLPKSGKDMPKPVVLPQPDDDVPVAFPTDNPPIDDVAFRDFAVKYIGALVENTINMRERMIRMGKRQRLMERILAKIYTDLGGSVESISELMVDDEESGS